MATVNFNLLGKSTPSNIYCRFIHTREYQFRVRTNILINPKFWNAKQQKIKNTLEVKNRNDINRKLSFLKQHIIDDFNESYSNGVLIDKLWLENSIKKFFKRPTEDFKEKIPDRQIYLIDYCKWWIEEKVDDWASSSGKTSFSKNTIHGYKNSINSLSNFIESEYLNSKKLLLKDCGHDTLKKYIQYLKNKGHSNSTVNIKKSRLRFFLSRAVEDNLEVDTSYQRRIFIPKEKEILYPFLNIEELQKIFNIEIKDKKLDDARDNLLIACWTALRISDFNNKLSEENISKDGHIFLETTKTGAEVVIPLHPVVKYILKKRDGKLPDKVKDSLFNKRIREVCKLCGINELTEGSLFDNKKKLKIRGTYEKYKLVTSHIGRRSFATNHFGEIDEEIIMKIGGWKNKEIMHHYVKTRPTKYASKLKNYWDETYNEHGSKK